MSTAELKSNLVTIINAINDSSTLNEIYSFVSKRKVGSKDSVELEKQDWSNLSTSSLSNAYSDDEPDYSNIVVKEPNPEYGK